MRFYRVCFLVLFLIITNCALAVDIIRKDGFVHHNVKDLQQLDDIFIFSVDNAPHTLQISRIERIVDRRGNIIFVPEELTAIAIFTPGEPLRFEFMCNDTMVGVGQWQQIGIFSISDRGLKNGVYKQFSDTGYLEREFTIDRGMLNGKCRVYYQSGKIYRDGTFKNNREVETSTFYYPSGELKGRSFYRNGYRHGKTTLFYPSGNIQADLTFSNGEPDGIHTMYYESGAIQTRLRYSDGQKNGEITTYYETGKINMKGNYINGKMHGEMVTYYESG